MSRASLDVRQEYIAHVIRNECFKGHWLALCELLQREWWHRVWTIQEAVLGSDIRVICGPFVVEWDRIMQATLVFELCYRLMDELLEATIFSMTYHYLYPFQSGASRVNVIKSLELSIRKKKDPRLLQVSSLNESLSTLLDITRNYDATDPRDKVYAILGLLEELGYKSPLRVSYRISVEDLYTQVAMIIQQNSETLKVMSHVEVNPSTRQGTLSTLPSWVPNWTVPSSHKSIVERAAFLDLKQQTQDNQDSRGAKRNHQEQAISSNITTTGFQTEFPNPATAVPRRIGENTRHVDLRCFKTQVTGVLGSTDVSMRVVDAICGLMGARVPYILRSCGNSWMFVGPCHLLDLEVMNSLSMKELDAGRFTLRNFIIK
ncbi:hypothetical protein RAB80_003991 [Fusarium oxysporum f. sp. vasinfectum]|uniref:Heterokaryon incompatibility domain-containing protein n=1 Tax=Fusarium oxysporum f. sp. vasinfectum 25433 TaxID=1089449 RepID=X0KXX6_FUSOX|nr:hypothetical protein FOTG_13427 [Fusarium oxysporum f. sp. vasinfectum 25433]KAK2678810.1 hypothetical protein RAB80_003991 [Fusarium oxysporum f. sp. vasinfectum]KAK2936681.1 hypothetical protein FoTM2_004628 [Fusarium oxysporum f. sp. vasinfectum]